MWKMRKYLGCILTAAVVTEITMAIHERDVIVTVAGETFSFRTWPCIGTTLYITIVKDLKLLMNVSITGSHDNMVDDKENRWILKYYDTTKTISLLLCNISKHDEGLYQIHEGIYETSNDPFEREEGQWKLQLNVFDPDEIKTDSVGANTTIMEVKVSEGSSPHLYYYDQIAATFISSGCVVNEPGFYGRLKCTQNRNSTIYNIEIHNVTQRDTGLYKVVYENRVIQRCFKNITDQPMYAMLGEHVTLGWYYSQQGMKRTIRIIHPNDGVMMILQPSNNSTIMNNFQHRLLYSGVFSKSYMSFTLMNLSNTDTGVYRIKTMHGYNIPGGKQLTVQDIITASTGTFVALFTNATEVPASNSYGELISFQPVLIYVIPVVTGAGALILVTIGCLKWIQRKHCLRKEADQLLPHEIYESVPFSTPSTTGVPLLMQPAEEGRTGPSVPQFNALSNAILGLPYAAFPSTSASLNAPCNSTYLLTGPDNDRPRLKNITNWNESSENTNEKVSVGYVNDTDYDFLDWCSSVWMSSSANVRLEHNYNCITDGFRHRLALYAKIKNEPNPSLKEGASECGNEYEFVDISCYVDLEKTSNVDEIASKPTRHRTLSCHGTLIPINEFVHEAKEDEEYEKNETVINMNSVESVKVYGDGETMTIKDEESMADQKFPDNANNDHADIVL